jgi:hypothetical protein
MYNAEEARRDEIGYTEQPLKPECDGKVWM